MRCREGLVEVDVHDVEAHIAGAAFAEQGVEVGTVVVHQAASLVNHLSNFQHARLEDAEGVGVGHHHGCHLAACLIEELAKVLDIHRAVRQALHFYDFQSADGCRCGVRAVGRVGNQDFGAALVTAALVVCANDHQARQLAVGTGAGVQRELAEPCQFCQ